jgi:ribosome-binding factor A
MSIDRIKRVNEMIRRELSLGLFHIGQGEDADVGRISFVDVDVSRDLRSATVAVSIMAPETESHALMAWLHRHRVEFQSHIAKTVSLKYTPRLHFRVTQSIEKGDHVLNLLNEILPDEPEPTDVATEPNAGDDPDER